MVMIYSGLQNQTLKTLPGRTFSRIYRSLSARLFKAAKLFGYHDITLKLFLEIADSGGFERLIIEGKANQETCIDRWEEIIQENSKENASFQYQSYLSLMRGYSELLANHSVVKLLILKCQITYPFDLESVEELNKRGFKIDTSSKEAFGDSLEKAVTRCNVMVTKINMKQSEIETRIGKNTGKSDSFEKVLASLEVALGDGRNLPDDIKLSKYNALKNLAKQKQEAHKSKK